MVKGLRILKQRRTDAGCFSEFLIATTPNDVENRAPPQAPSFRPVVVSAAAPAASLKFAQAGTVPATVASFVTVSTACTVVATPPQALPSRVTMPTSHQLRLASAGTAGNAACDSVRRARRRERNRVAAAKCRKRRQDQIDGLSDTACQLEASNSQLQEQIDELAETRRRLSVLLRRHRLECPFDVGLPDFALDDNDEFAEADEIDEIEVVEEVESSLPEAACFSPPMVTCGSPPPSLRRPCELPLPPAEPMETNLASLATPASGLLTPLLLAVDAAGVKLEPHSL